MRARRSTSLLLPLRSKNGGGRHQITPGRRWGFFPSRALTASGIRNSSWAFQRRPSREKPECPRMESPCHTWKEKEASLDKQKIFATDCSTLNARQRGRGRRTDADGKKEGRTTTRHDNDDGPYLKLCITLVPAGKVAIERFSNVPIPGLSQPPAHSQDLHSRTLSKWS